MNNAVCQQNFHRLFYPLSFRDFTVEFLVGGYGRLVGILANELPFSTYPSAADASKDDAQQEQATKDLIAATFAEEDRTRMEALGRLSAGPANSNVDPAHFLWLVTYFLKFATQIPVDFVHLRLACPCIYQH